MKKKIIAVKILKNYSTCICNMWATYSKYYKQLIDQIVGDHCAVYKLIDSLTDCFNCCQHVEHLFSLV